MKHFTVLEGERRLKQIDWGPAPLPPCQAHLIEAGVECTKPGEFDSPTTSGPWADLCRDHVQQYAPANQSLGYHRMRQDRG